jgi:ABC-type multidrug transport system permease subunit
MKNMDVIKEVNYKKELTKVLTMAAIGAVIGYGLGMGMEKDLEMQIMMAYFGAGVPFGWKLIGKIIPFNIIGFSIGALFFMVIKLGLAALTGMLALPILIIYYIIKITQK